MVISLNASLYGLFWDSLLLNHICNHSMRFLLNVFYRFVGRPAAFLIERASLELHLKKLLTNKSKTMQSAKNHVMLQVLPWKVLLFQTFRGCKSIQNYGKQVFGNPFHNHVVSECSCWSSIIELQMQASWSCHPNWACMMSGVQHHRRHTHYSPQHILGQLMWWITGTALPRPDSVHVAVTVPGGITPHTWGFHE